MERVTSIRGAITVKENTIKDIKEATVQLISEIFRQNKLSEQNIINIIFTVTQDLDSVNPATILREELKLNSTPMLCVQEIKVKGGLPKCIRVLIQTYSTVKKNEVKHIYVGDAEKLRPDLSYEV